MRHERAGVERLYLERMDILETLPKKGCNAQGCRRAVVSRYAGPFSIRRLCVEHEKLYWAHDLVLARIRAIPNRDIL
jgi:hypothetical protein